jgi:hypothetical protein
MRCYRGCSVACSGECCIQCRQGRPSDQYYGSSDPKLYVEKVIAVKGQVESDEMHFRVNLPVMVLIDLKNGDWKAQACAIAGYNWPTICRN